MKILASGLFLVSLALSVTSAPSERAKSDPDQGLNTTELIKSKGYPVEDHDVHTLDGYILDVQRIPSSQPGPKRTVFLQHGLADSSSTWAVNFKTQSLAFILADAGYDVWLGNMRGNKYGRRHESLNPDDDAFWNFSFDEMSDFDLTAMVDYALKVTNQAQLIYIGHSQGTMIQFVQLSKNQAFASKIKLFVALGPVATVGHIKSPVKYLSEIGKPSHQLIFYTLFGKKEFFSSSAITNFIGDKCNIEIVDKEVCKALAFTICGPSVSVNITRLPVYLSHFPSGTSVKNMVHFAQMVVNGKFQMYDYASASENMKHYNQTTPPLYDLTQVKVPVALYWGQQDWLADPDDVELIRKSLPNIVDEMDIEFYDHLDFVWGTNVKTILYDRMMQLMLKYN
jgi:pimeloyl-ACP methyl ester carboxylesterase